MIALLAAVGIPVAASILYTFPPAEYSFYPGCWFNKVTGLHCPGCGATRSLHALLHGDWEQAFAYNSLFVILSPWLLYGICRMTYSMWTGKKAPGPGLSANGTKILFGILIAYWIARNIDVYPLTLLAPHVI